jgi:hypothetical protein
MPKPKTSVYFPHNIGGNKPAPSRVGYTHSAANYNRKMGKTEPVYYGAPNTNFSGRGTRNNKSIANLTSQLKGLSGIGKKGGSMHKNKTRKQSKKAN